MFVSSSIGSSPSISTNTGVFGSIPSILKESQNLKRRMKIYSILSKSGAMKCDDQALLMKVWKEAQPQLNALNFREILQTCRDQTVRINGDFHLTYSEIESIDSLDTAKQLVKRFWDDRHYLADSMVLHSDAGDRGALLVTYPSFETKKDHVIKWVNPLEVDSTRIYQLFSSCFPNTFLVPRFVQINLDRKMHVSLSGESTPIQDTLFYPLKKNYHELLNDVPQSDQTIESITDTLRNVNLMFSEKVQGEGFFDFINAKYSELNPYQKENLFNKLGHLVLIDLLLHHNDRINVVKFNNNTLKYELALMSQGIISEGTNLNNLMIDLCDDLVMYAIDNGLEGDKSLEEAALYTEFLKDLFTQENWINSVSQAMAETFENTLSDGVGLSDQENLFIEDLKLFGMQAIQSSITDLYRNLTLRFPNFQTNELNPILASSPILLSAISDRSNLLLSLRNNHDT